MIRNIALALTIAAVSTSAAAQSTKDDPYKWLNDQLKPYEAKTTAPDPNTPTSAVPMDSTREPLAGNNNSLLDGCVITAIGRLPKVDGMRVINTAYEHRSSSKQVDTWAVGVLVDLRGKRSTFQYTCEVFDNTSARLVNR